MRLIIQTVSDFCYTMNFFREDTMSISFNKVPRLA